MDSERFDRLARAVAAAKDRRWLLRVAAATAVFGVVGRSRDLVSTAQEPQPGCPTGCRGGQVCLNGLCVLPCEENRDCRDKDDDACTGGTCVDGVCQHFIVDCAMGHVCCGNGECCPAPCTTDLDCVSGDPCQIGRCGEEGTCEFSENDGCIRCFTTNDCGPYEERTGQVGVCCNGACVTACPAGLIMGKGCECMIASAANNADGISVTVVDNGDSGVRVSNPPPATPAVEVIVS